MNSAMKLVVERIVQSGMTGTNVLSKVNSVLNNAKRNDWLGTLSSKDALSKINRDMSNWSDRKLVKVMTYFLMQTVMKKMSIREWEQIADAVDNKKEFDRAASASLERKVATELVSVAKALTSAMPYGRDAGKVKRAITNVLKRAGYENINVLSNRGGSGFTGYGNLFVTHEDSSRTKEREKELKKALAKFEQNLKSIDPKPDSVWTDIRSNRDSFQASIGMLYDKGHQVTPLEML